MVLLDSATPEQFTALPNYSGSYSMYRRVSGALSVAARFGLGRIAAATQFAGLPASARDLERSFAATARDFNGQRDEWAELPTAFAQAKALTSFGTKPLIVLTAERRPADRLVRRPGQAGHAVEQQRPPHRSGREPHGTAR